MKRIILLLGLFLMLTLSVIVNAKVVIFLYHRFEDARYPSTNTWINELENHIRTVKELGFDIWTMKDLEDYVYRRKNSTKDAVVFTVDDGYRSVYDHAYRVFKKHNVPFCVFVQVGAVGYPDYLNWEMINEMIKDGVEFANHSFSHSDFPMLLSKMEEKELLEYFRRDLRKSQQLFKEKTNVTLRYYAYPYGHYIPQMIDVLKEENLVLGFTQDPGPYDRAYGAFEIPREPLIDDWASEKHLRYILSREPLIAEGTPFSLQNDILTVNLRILVPKEVRYATLYVSEKGLIKSDLNGDIISGTTKLTKKYNRLMISARDTQKEYLRYYLLFYAQGE
ncbi:polysaccharide deacetylase family protein [Pseudothermotoga sp. U03pept]|uniref:polysaccharide deacetylase family protein n=1 Tax=Pseudothermotoga sp. U03pept TaxID=3447012 RepID=UPI003EFD9D14